MLILILSIASKALEQASSVAPVVIISSTNKICLPFREVFSTIEKSELWVVTLFNLSLNTCVVVALVLIKTSSL